MSQDDDLAQRIESLMRRTVESGNPNCNRLNETLRGLPVSRLNAKTTAYELAKLHRVLNREKASRPRLRHFGLSTKLCTAADLESPWAAHWLAELRVPFAYHRKNWELCFVLQALYEKLRVFKGKRGLGFGCGTEKLPSYLASRRSAVTATDSPPALPGADSWIRTQQHASGRDQLFHSELISRSLFDTQVTFDFVDMNDIPNRYHKSFDFCWSVCALEHLGSIEKGMQFVENSLSVLDSGGVAVHTLEFNLDEGETIDNWPTVLFQRKQVEELGRRIEKAGGVLLAPDYDEGTSFYDRYIDTPPYDVITNEIHLKLEIDGFRCTCLGLIIEKK